MKKELLIKLRLKYLILISFSALFFSIASCNSKRIENDDQLAAKALFDVVKSTDSNVDFANDLVFTDEYNPYTFKNFFNGGGVALGDINNDGLLDIYFSGSLVDNKLYLNKGNLVFEDITANAGVACSGVWSSGVSFVDINADGLLDIYVCKSGRPEAKVRHNELFINQGDLSFREESRSYGLDFEGLSTQAVFFDYDRDGDLDCYLLNNSIRSVGAYDIAPGLRDIYDESGGNRLLRNPGLDSKDRKFIDVSREAGIYGSAIGFGLGVSVADFNRDGWPDMYVSNDFFEKDYLYLNDQKGHFQEVIDESLQETSMGAMGADIGDINGDGLYDIFVTEMRPSTLERLKSKAVFESYNKSMLNTAKGYHRQFGRNTLNVLQGFDDNGIPLFSEVSRLAGVDATEWSWGALMQDFDNDGLLDIFVANGIYKDLLDLDYVNFFNPSTIKKMINNKENVIVKMMNDIPAQASSNHLYINQGNYAFKDKAVNSSLGIPSFSNGSAYGDLDNDGDLDLVINHIGEKSAVYQNRVTDRNFIQLVLKYAGENPFAIGSEVLLYQGAKTQIRSLFPYRGFQSSVDNKLHFGLDAIGTVDSIVIIWPNGEAETIVEPGVNQLYKVEYDKRNQRAFDFSLSASKTLLLKKNEIGIAHIENETVDFDYERLKIISDSNEGPFIEVLDVNRDGRDDIVRSSSKEQSPEIFYQTSSGGFTYKVLEGTYGKAAENQALLKCDFDDDGNLDVLMVNGGNEVNPISSGMKDMLYLNTKDGLVESPSTFNTGFANHSCACAIRIEPSKKLGIFLGGQSQSKSFGVPTPSQLMLRQDEEFSPVSQVALRDLKLVSDCSVSDINGDGLDDLIVSESWGSMHIFIQDSLGILHDESTKYKLDSLYGLWSQIEVMDIDLDGDDDIIAANIGMNNGLYAAGAGNPVIYFVNDFDRNGKPEAIACIEKSGQFYPLHLRDDFLMQLPSMKKRFLQYKDYAKASMNDIFTEELLERSLVYRCNEFQSGVFVNEEGHFFFVPLPIEAQFTVQKALKLVDLNNDDLPDIIMGGNDKAIKPEFGSCLSSYGSCLINQGDHSFRATTMAESGFVEKGEIRNIETILINDQLHIVVAKNGAPMSLYKVGNDER